MIGSRIGWLIGVAVLAMIFQAVPARAQSGLSRRDRMLLYTDYYSNRLNNRQAQKFQKRIETDVRDFRDLYKADMERVNADPVERYMREGRDGEPTRERLPPIYAGRRNYFMRLNQFNPPTRH